ncbi:MAG: cyclic 2,3-diphosphoglycerate synthase [Desulfosarcinaceae bacterium]
MVEKVIIMGAAGRDFHNFNVYFRDNERYEVIAFTATQIPDIEGRRYPAELSGRLYPDGIPIHRDTELVRLIRDHGVDLVAFSYSDVPHTEVMHKASQVTAAGADFILAGAPYTMLSADCPVVSVCAVRTGCGKSQTSREVCRILKAAGKRVVIIRHPMPYGDLRRQIVQRFSTYADLDTHRCTIEEREEYEPVIDMGAVIYAGIDYEKILRQAETEADMIIWDGGNNDTPFYKPDVAIVVFDPHRAGHETRYHPGETNMLMADIAVINKVDSASPENVAQVTATIQAHNAAADIVRAESAISIDDPDDLSGKRVLVVEDGPTLTHGEMGFGAGVIAAQRFGAAEVVDPRPHLVGSLAETYQRYPHIGRLLPAMGYSAGQVADLEATINATPCDIVAMATPIDLRRLMQIDRPVTRIRYSYKDYDSPTLEGLLQRKLSLN